MGLCTLVVANEANGRENAGAAPGVWRAPWLCWTREARADGSGRVRHGAKLGCTSQFACCCSKRKQQRAGANDDTGAVRAGTLDARHRQYQHFEHQVRRHAVRARFHTRGAARDVRRPAAAPERHWFEIVQPCAAVAGRVAALLSAAAV